MTSASPGPFPAVAEALLSGASAQLRNAATVGGNLLQRTRCAYFHDLSSACNRRAPGSGCDALDGENRLHAVLGWSEHCIATHPSDFCVPLAALDAVVEVEGANGAREVPFDALHVLPGTTPRAGNGAVARRTHYRDAPPRSGCCLRAQRPLSETARAHLLCVRRRFRGRRAGDRRRRIHAGAHRAGRRCRETLAGRRGGSGAGRRTGERPTPSPALPIWRSPTRGPPATTPSRSNWRAASSCAL